MQQDNRLLLGVNIDHIATLRQARGTRYPDPVQAALTAELAGADSITLHLREDKRHIQDRDVNLIAQVIQTKMNLEMAVTEEMIRFAEKLAPADCCLVPEKREELTTEGGLDVVAGKKKIKEACDRLGQRGTRCSLFIDADEAQINAAAEIGAPVIEIHTGHYADARTDDERHDFLVKIKKGVETGLALGLQVNAGHGLHYHNVLPIAEINQITELNIGHAIICQALFVGLGDAVKEMKALMLQARP